MTETIRRSTAKTALGLLGGVKRHVLAEPTSVDMQDIAYPTETTPCGTAGCIAGWCCLLTLPRIAVLGSCTLMPRREGRMTFAERLLGQEPSNGFSLTSASYERDLVRFFDMGSSDGIAKLTPGTRAYASAVARRIDRFVKKHRARLAKTRIADVIAGGR